MKLGHALSDSVSRGFGTPGRKFSRGFEESRENFGLRSGVVLVFTVGIFLLLLATLFRLQIFQGSYFRALAEGNRVNQRIIHAPRGIIFDRHGEPLVANTPAYRLVSCDESGMHCQSSVISKDQAIDLESRGLSSGQKLEVDAARKYLFGSALAHVLGYVSEVTQEELGGSKNYQLGDRIGRGGVEEFFQDELRGKDGRQLVEVDATGKQEKEVAVVSPVPGRNLTLAIDSSLQKSAADLLAGKKGAIVASDPNTGEILALVSSPAFDPNVFTDLTLSGKDRQLAVSNLFGDPDLPLFDRAIAGTYPPGSTFKLVGAVAGLESKAINESTTIDDPGVLVIGPYRFPNWKFLRDGGTQGVLNVVSAIQKSNDIFFYRVGEWTGLDTFTSWAEKFGLNNKLGIDLPGEATGVVPDKTWREQNTRSWYLGDTYHLAIGQGDLLVTPLQMNFWTGVIANGGKLCRPEILSGNNRGQCKDLGISQKTIDLVRQGMVAACSPGGTAYPLFDFKPSGKPIQVACKTGTAEFGDPNNRTHAWLTAYAPAVSPQIAVSVLVEGAGEGSDVAAPIVKKVLEEWFR